MTKTIIDLGLTKNELGVYDLTLDDTGDLAQIAGFDTALLMSLFCERRADASEVPAAHLRRGWWGNTVGDDPTFEIGSKLWIVVAQPRVVDEVRNRAIAYIVDGLAWLKSDGYLDDVRASAQFTGTAIQVKIDLLRSQSVIDSKYYDVWQASGKQI